MRDCPVLLLILCSPHSDAMQHSGSASSICHHLPAQHQALVGLTTPARSARSGGWRLRPAFHWSKAARELTALVSRRLASANLTTIGTSEPGSRVLPLWASIASSASAQRLNCTKAHPAHP